MEVMMSLGVVTLAASGVFAMQKATLVGNNNARMLSAATTIAQGWAERMRIESLMWNAPKNLVDDLTDTTWLENAVSSNPAWFNPVQVLAGTTTPAGSAVADVNGADIFTGDTSAAAFCTKMRLLKLAAYPTMIRVEIRVYWDRSRKPVVCSAIPDPQTGDNAQYGFVSITTSILQNTSP